MPELKRMPELVSSEGRCAICNTQTKLKCQGCVQRCRSTSELRFYCGKDHQIADWKNGHKTVCGAKTKAESLAYQFKITLLGAEQPFIGDMIQPPIWRLIQIRKNSTFRDLRKAILLSMGWFESHLHEFRMESGKIIGMPNDDDFGMGKKTIQEKSVNEKLDYPTCVGGARACPPEGTDSLIGS